MKKIILLSVVSMLVCSCFKQVEIIEIDGCEYVVYNGRRESSIVHKQNCKNHE